MRVEVAQRPPAEPPEGRTCLVVDVLRATSVVAVLLGRGVRAVYPAATIEQGRALRDRLAREGAAPMLCGEVDARPPEGYDHGNSPTEFEALPALPQTAVMATTNGTPALLACRAAPLTLAAAPLNASAAVGLAVAAGRDVLVVAAGHPRGPAEDDLLAAGLLVERLAARGAQPEPQACEAMDRYVSVRSDFAAALRATPHGRRLVEIGYGGDVERCATIDRYDCAGVLGFEAGRAVLRPAGMGA